jgi:hypothetical protein
MRYLKVPLSTTVVRPKRFGIVPEFVLLKIDCCDFWSRICYPGPIRNYLFLRQIRERTQTFWLHSYQISERLWNVCSFTVLTLLYLVCLDGLLKAYLV